MKIEIELFGPIPTVKDSYRAVVRDRKNPKPGKSDKIAQIVKDSRLNSKLNYLIEQIPVEVWDLELSHPSITMQRYAPPEYLQSVGGPAMSDRDGAFSTILDLLVRTGTIRNDDSDKNNNGLWIIHPTQVAPEFRLRITLEAKGNVN